jgi:cobalt/nickel transport system permease protein
MTSTMSPEHNAALPEWIRGSSAPANPKQLDSRRKLTGFTEKTIHSILHLSKEALFSEQYSRKPGLLQRVDPRSKLLATLAVLVTASLAHSHWLLWTIYALVLLLALASDIEFWFFFKRVWIFVPLATSIIALPAILNWVTEGRPVLVLHQFQSPLRLGPWSFPTILAVSDNGIQSVLLFVSRVGVSISVVVLLTLTTAWQKLLRSLRVLGVPQFFVFTLGMTYRYIHLLLNVLLDIHLGKKSRTLRASSASQEQKWVASRMGYLFKRSHHLGESVYGAMLSRGFQGEPKLLEELQWSLFDSLAITITVSFCAVALMVQRFLLL